MQNYRLHHIGYLVSSIENTISEFRILGYDQSSSVVNDDTQRTKICFLTKNEEPLVELVEPYEDNKTMNKMLNKRGTSPYHLCYEVDDINKEYERLIEKNWTPLFNPVEAPAFDNRLICYFWNSEIGFIELLNKK